MAHENKITTSLHGRRLGLEQQSSAESGGSRGTKEYLVGAEALRSEATTAETTSNNLNPYGVSHLNSSSAGSSQVYTLDPPVPGVPKISTTPRTRPLTSRPRIARLLYRPRAPPIPWWPCR